MCFTEQVTGGTLGLNDETTEVGYFLPDEIQQIDLMKHHHERINDALANQKATFVR